MDAIRTKDKLFLAVVIPLALAAAYVYFWRTDAVRRVEALRQEEASLVAVDDFPDERKAAENRLAAAKERLEAEKRTPAPVTRVKAKVDEDIAARERAVLGVFRQAGLKVESSRDAAAGDEAARETLVRTGLRPTPVCRSYAIVGSYPQITAALQRMVEREMAIIPSRVEMTAPHRWTLSLWL